LTPRESRPSETSGNEKALAEFVEKRRAFLQARPKAPREDMRRFRERLPPTGTRFPPNRFVSHFFLLQNSELYRAASGQDLISEDLDLELLGPKSKQEKETPKQTP